MSLFSLNRPVHHARKRHQLRPRLDALEGRLLLTAGALDPTFGSGGEVLTSFPPLLKGFRGTGGDATFVTIQSDGKIVAAGEGLHDFALARYNTNGSLDSSFGNGGKVVTTFGTNHEDSASALAIQSDGKIIAVGSTNILDSTTYLNHFAIARYNTNGTLDTTFGPNHNGLVTTSILGDDTAFGGIVQPDGKIVVCGIGSTSSSSITTSEILVRYNSDGTLDTSFGNGGIITMTIVPGVRQGFGSVALETINVGGIPTTKIVAGGTFYPTGSVLARFNLDGSLDPSFGSGGTVILQTVNPVVVVQGVTIQPDGKIVEPGTATNSQGVRDAAVVRFNVDGSLDTSFDPNGPMPGLVDLGVAGLADRLILQPDGKILVGGYATSPTMLARLNGVDGSLDATFGTNGLVLMTLTGSPTVKGLALQSDGKIVMAGGANSNGDFAVARFLNQAPTTTALASSANPSISGQSVTFTATISTAGTTSPTGTVQFFDGSTLLGTGALRTASGVTTATFTTSTLAVGTHAIMAVYGGDSNDMGSTSAVLSQVVNATASSTLVIGAARSARTLTTIAPSLPDSFIVPLALDDPAFLDTVGSGNRRHTTSISPWIGSSER